MDRRDDFSAGGGEHFSFRIIVACHRCDREEEMSVSKKTWLDPYFVRQHAGSWIQSQLCPSCARWHLSYWIKVVWKLRIGRLSSALKPGYGACLRCHTNWYYCEGHKTAIPNTAFGVFPLCERCWRGLTPVERLHYYRVMYDKHEADLVRYNIPQDYTWAQLGQAVLDEAD